MFFSCAIWVYYKSLKANPATYCGGWLFQWPRFAQNSMLYGSSSQWSDGLISVCNMSREPSNVTFTTILCSHACVTCNIFYCFICNMLLTSSIKTPQGRHSWIWSQIVLQNNIQLCDSCGVLMLIQYVGVRSQNHRIVMKAVRGTDRLIPRRLN